jgi:hypothetical protein
MPGRHGAAPASENPIRHTSQTALIAASQSKRAVSVRLLTGCSRSQGFVLRTKHLFTNLSVISQ